MPSKLYIFCSYGQYHNDWINSKQVKVIKYGHSDISKLIEQKQLDRRKFLHYV